MSDWQVDQLIVKDKWKCVLTISGVQSVAVDGIAQMQTLFADSLVIQNSVRLGDLLLPQNVSQYSNSQMLTSVVLVSLLQVWVLFFLTM